MQTDFRRYLVDIDSITTQQMFTDCLVIGAGVAGLRAAIEAAQNCNVIIVCKGTLKNSNTWKAQGGIASVVDKNDSFESHISDTLKAGCGICDTNIVEMTVRQGPELVKQLVDWGTELDFVDGHMDATYEGGHSNPRIIHGHGDETGRAIAEGLIKKLKSMPNVKVIENFYAIDLITENSNGCLGVIGQYKRLPQIIWASNTILATGGCGQLYRETTNPEVATADGLAMAYRANVILQDLEFVQFHPTTLYIAGASRALITEALRGEGAKLVDCNGYQFMKDYDERAELAPRDIVSRAILNQMLKTNATHVYLDVKGLGKEFFAKRFPLINELCESFDIDVTKDLIPVRPSAHYMIGGVKTDSQARTNVKNLFACGEAASTGLHGANRLGSNSLLEGLVFGKIAGHLASCEKTSFKVPAIKYKVPHSSRTRLDTQDVRNSLRSLMWRNVGITRNEQALREAQEIISFWHRYVMDKVFENPDGWECQNMLTISLLMAQIAQQRKESRGVHFRNDYPKRDDNAYQKHFETVRGK